MAEGSLYFHSPCFDGIVSAVLAWDFLEAKEGLTNPSLHPVNYDLRENWLSRLLPVSSSVVDFLYHPMAQFWADHHGTTFLTDEARQDFFQRVNPLFIYDSRAGSCAALLWERLYKTFNHRNIRYADIVGWADKTDSAAYSSVEEAIHPTTPAFQVNLTLALSPTATYCEDLVRALREASIEEVANRPEVQARIKQVTGLVEAGLTRFKQGARLHDGIVRFDVDSTNVIISRYAPYYFFPDARYSVGIVRWERGARITAMRNPWRDFQSVPLGRIAEKLGGGGHQRVGSILLRDDGTVSAKSLLKTFISEIQHADDQLRERA